MLRRSYSWFVAFGALWLGWAFGLDVGAHFFPRYVRDYAVWVWIAGGLIVGLPVIWTGKGLAALTAADLAGNTSALVRRPIGWLWGSLAALLSLAMLSPLVLAGFFFAGAVGLLACSAVLLLLPRLLSHVKHVAGRRIAPIRRKWRAQRPGKGGSSAIAGLFEHWANPWKPGAFLLGLCTYCPQWQVGLVDDRHTMVIASNRAWKGRGVIIPNLLTWAGSVLCIDPKGTNALVTAARRGNGGGRVKKGIGQKVFALNPFNLNDGVPGMPPPARFNPLSVLDPHSTTFYEDLESIADALVVPSSNDPFWDESAKSLLRAVIGFVVMLFGHKASLFDVRDALADISDPKHVINQEMAQCGGVIADAAAQISAAEDRLRSGIIATALKHTDWLGSSAMQNTLCGNDFTLADLKGGGVTVYLILPPQYLETHSRFMRLFINLMVKAASIGGKSKAPILFLLDEFYSLGPMPSLAKAAGNLAGYNIKLMPIIQNLSQLIELYPHNWEGFISSTGHLQVFGINDDTTAQYVSNRLGRTIVYAFDMFGNKVPAGTVDLRERVEVTQEASRISGRQIVFREGEDPMVLERIDYLHHFPESMFNRDVDY